ERLGLRRGWRDGGGRRRTGRRTPRRLGVAHHAVVHALGLALAPDNRESPVAVPTLETGGMPLGTPRLEGFLDQRLLGRQLAGAAGGKHREDDDDGPTRPE